MRVRRFQQATVAEAQQLIAAMGLGGPHESRPSMLYRRVDQRTARNYGEIYHWPEPGELVASAPKTWAADWDTADPGPVRALTR